MYTAPHRTRLLDRRPAALLCSLWLALAPLQARADSATDARLDHAVELLRDARRQDSPTQAQALGREALHILDDVLASSDATPAQQRRAAMDRVVALSRLGLAREALDAHASVTRQYPTVPAYVRSAAGDAHAALGQPEPALALYEDALRDASDDDAPHAGRIFALADLDRGAEAERILRERLQDGSSVDLRTDRLRLALVRAWGGWADQSAADVSALAEAAPHDAELARQQGGLELLRDRPHAALAAYDRALSIEPGYFGAALDRAVALDRLGRFREADAVLAALADEGADWPPMQRLQQRRRVDRAASLDARVRAARGGDREIADGEVRAETTLWTPLSRSGWRAFVAWRRAWADFRGTSLEDERLAAGLRLQAAGFRVTVEGDRAQDRLVDASGLSIAVDARISDDWSIGASHARNAFDLPLRARGAGTTGNRHSAAVRYSPSASRWARLAVTRIDYSDGNRREELGISASHTLPLTHRLALQIAPGLYTGRNRTDDVPYYSPLRDTSAELAMALDHRIHARLGRRHVQRLEGFAGAYDQRGFDTEPFGGLRYEYRFEPGPGRRLFARIGRDRRIYDGVAEYQTFAELGLQHTW